MNYFIIILKFTLIIFKKGHFFQVCKRMWEAIEKTKGCFYFVTCLRVVIMYDLIQTHAAQLTAPFHHT